MWLSYKVCIGSKGDGTDVNSQEAIGDLFKDTKEVKKHRERRGKVEGVAYYVHIEVIEEEDNAPIWDEVL